MAAGWVNRPAAATILAVSAYLTGASCRACYLRALSMALDHRVLTLLRLGHTDLKILSRIAMLKETRVARVTMLLIVECNITVHKMLGPVGLTVSVWTRWVPTVRWRMAPWGTIMTAREIADDDCD